MTRALTAYESALHVALGDYLAARDTLALLYEPGDLRVVS